MAAQSIKPCLSAVFVDYDNIYLSLKRKNEEAAKRFAKDAGSWIQEIASGRLITPTNSSFGPTDRRMVMNRCYGNPVPRRNSQDNSTDMSSFPFVRHHFLRSGFEIIDCPPLTAQLKNSSDIRMVMDVRDFLNHETYFDEFVILSGDADFTPLLHRLRAHARRTVIFANDYTAAPYTSICDGEIREADLITLLLDGQLPGENEDGNAILIETDSRRNDVIRNEIIEEVVNGVRAAAAPVPLEALADRALRNLGHEKTAGSSWGGTGGFRELLNQGLPDDIQLSDKAPYYAFDAKRHVAPAAIAPPAAEQAVQSAEDAQPVRAPAPAALAPTAPPVAAPALQPEAIATRPPQTAEQSYAAAANAHAGNGAVQAQAPAPTPLQPVPAQPAAAAQHAPQSAPQQPITQPPAPQQQMAEHQTDAASAMQQSIARIHDACQAPTLAPPEYRVLFEVMADEINENGLTGAQTLSNISNRALSKGLDIQRDDVRFVLDVVSETDPWFEQGASANLFAGRFRNFVVARCRGQGLNLSAEELDLIEAWFAGAAPTVAAAPQATAQEPSPRQAPAPDYREQITDPAEVIPGEEFPRIVRSRLRG